MDHLESKSVGMRHLCTGMMHWSFVWNERPGTIPTQSIIEARSRDWGIGVNEWGNTWERWNEIDTGK